MLQITQEAGILTITFDRPDKFNSFNRALALGVQDALKKAADDQAILMVLHSAAS
jgi:enoyl-CoA hydratase/carnithine racemase